MGCEPDVWAKEWLEKQRSEGNTGLTVEKRGGVHYLKWATTKWDPETKKRRKISEYRGVLNPDGSVTEPRPRRDRVNVTDVKDSGNARLLAYASKDILEAMKDAFPNDYPEIMELVFTRCLGKGELNKAGRCWNRLEDVFVLRPNTSPKSLSETLERVGASRGCQDIFFGNIRVDEGEMAIDMSVIFSKARGAYMCKCGYNRFRLSCPQYNLLMGCGLISGRPQYMRVVPGNVKEGSAVSMLDEFDIPEGTVLVMDRGYGDKNLLAAIRERDLDYIVAARRNSKGYGITDTSEGMFRWRDSAVSYGHSQMENGDWAYRFENLTHRNDELVDTLKAQEQGKDRKINSEKAGNFLIIASKEFTPENVYRLYKTRCSIEDDFDTAKNFLTADKTYLREDQHIMGHLFITFVAISVRFEITRLLEKADLLSKYSPNDVLDIYATIKSFTGDADIRQIVPKDVRDLDARLGLFMYSTPEDLERLNGVKHKRGRKPKASGSS